MQKRTNVIIMGVLTVIMLSLVICNNCSQAAEEEDLKKAVDLTRYNKLDEAIGEFNKIIAEGCQGAGG